MAQYISIILMEWAGELFYDGLFFKKIHGFLKLWNHCNFVKFLCRKEKLFFLFKLCLCYLPET